MMTAKEIITSELEWIVPGEHQWDLVLVGDKQYRTVFPSKADLTRLTKIRDLPIAHKACFLHFDDWNATSVGNFDLEEAWVRVSGCPYKLRCDYLALFAVGSLIGKAKEIAMEFTRAHDVVRMLVQCTSVAHTDHMYDGKGYGITFEVEGGRPPKGDEPTDHDKPHGDDKAQEDGEEKQGNSGKDGAIKEKAKSSTKLLHRPMMLNMVKQ
jgi:hypothetical protein